MRKTFFVVDYENPLKYTCESESSVKHIYLAIPIPILMFHLFLSKTSTLLKLYKVTIIVSRKDIYSFRKVKTQHIKDLFFICVLMLVVEDVLKSIVFRYTYVSYI